MADDNTFQSQRSPDPSMRTAEPRLSSETDDPLAELARLIGQSESFAQSTRDNARREQVAQAAPTLAPDSWQYPSTRSEQVTSAGSRDPYGSNQDFAGSPTHDAEDLRAETGQQVHWGAEHQQYAHQGDGTQDEHAAPDLYVQDEAPLEPHEDEMYDDPPRVRRRGGLVTALVLVGCAVLGTASAYAYRSYFGHARATQPPPIITADSSAPLKIVPATAGDPQAGKAIQDRAAVAGKEQLVSKQEEPVSLKEAGSQAAPRAIPPAPVAPAATGAPAQQPTGAPPASASNEPKKVRTVTIRPDGTDVSGRPAGAPGLLPGTTATAPRSATNASASRAPLSLDAQSAEPAAAPPSRTRTATAPSPPRAAPEAATGGFVVQLSSQKSESEAQASFRSLQAKFPDELGGRQPIIRRVDLGNKGVFYRTMVGPFASGHEASQFCANYKAAGGQCMVPNN
jgi:SPOR domain